MELRAKFDDQQVCARAVRCVQGSYGGGCGGQELMSS